jgi:deazaflavin-dependent oxidoreductase (nitroreductase family)
MVTTQYQEPNRATRAANAAIRWLAETGVSIAGTRALRVRGRTTGKQRSVVVNLLTVDGVDYLVSPRGNTQWVRNVRAAGALEVGPRWRRRPATAREPGDAEKPEVLRRYLARWYWQVKSYVHGLTPESDDEQLRVAASSIPVFALTPAGGGPALP